MYRAYSICQASCNPESYQKRQNDYYYTRAKSTAKSAIDNGAPRKFDHISRFTGSSLYKKRESQREIDKSNLKIFANMRKTFDSTSPYSQANCKSFELRKRISTRGLEEREKVLVNETYVRKIAVSMKMPTSQQLAIYEQATGEKYNAEMAVNLVEKPREIKRKLLLNPNIRSVYQYAYYERDFDQQQTYALNKCHKAPVIPELVAVRRSRQRFSYSGRGGAEQIGSVCDGQEQRESDHFDVHEDEQRQTNDKEHIDDTAPDARSEGEEIVFADDKKPPSQAADEQEVQEPKEAPVDAPKHVNLGQMIREDLEEKRRELPHDQEGYQPAQEGDAAVEGTQEPKAGLKAALEDDLFDE